MKTPMNLLKQWKWKITVKPVELNEADPPLGVVLKGYGMPQNVK